jgi:hypothetical protein
VASAFLEWGRNFHAFHDAESLKIQTMNHLMETKVMLRPWPLVEMGSAVLDRGQSKPLLT